MAGKRRIPFLGRKGEPEPPAPQPPVLASPPLPRPASTPHHWLTVAVARQGPVGLVPVPGARVLVRAFPRGAPRPGEPVGRGTSAADGTFALQLPAGRYAVSATQGGEGKAVTVTLEHAGRATLVLESQVRRVVLTVEVASPQGGPLPGATVDIHAAHGGGLVARGAADERGVAAISLPPGAYEVRVGGARTRTYVEADTLLRMTSEGPRNEASAPAPVSRYVQKVRAATSYAAPLDVANVRDDMWN